MSTCDTLLDCQDIHYRSRYVTHHNRSFSSMNQGPPEGNSRSRRKYISRLLRNSKVHYRVYKNSTGLGELTCEHGNEPPVSTKDRQFERTGSWRKCEEFYNFHSSPDIISMTKSTMRWVTNKTDMGEKRNTYTILAGIPDGKRPKWNTLA
jgi:hypothetical protein